MKGGAGLLEAAYWEGIDPMEIVDPMEVADLLMVDQVILPMAGNYGLER